MKREGRIAGETPSNAISPADIVSFIENRADYQSSSSDDPQGANSDPNNSWGHGFAMLPTPTRTDTPTPTATTTPTATPTPTPTATAVTGTASLAAVPGHMAIGGDPSSTSITGSYTVPRGSWAAFRYSSHLKPRSDCTDEVVPDDSTRGSGTVRATLYGCTAGNATAELVQRPGDRVIATVEIKVSSGELIKSKDDVDIREVVLFTGSYNVPGGSATLTYSTELSRSNRCSFRNREEGERREITFRGTGTLSRTLYGCRAGTGTVRLITLPDRVELASVDITVNESATPTPTPTATSTPSPTATSTPTLVPPRITGSSLSGTRLRVNYTRPSGTSYFKFRIYRSYYGENDFNEYDSETDLRSPVYFSGLPRGYTYYVRGQSCRDRSYSDCDGPGNSSSRRTVPTLTPTSTPTRTPTPTATPVPVPVPSNLSYRSGTTWIRFDWDGPSGYNRFEVTFNGRVRTAYTSSYFAAGLQSGRSYRISVRTVASDGRTSVSRSLTGRTQDPSPTPTPTATATPVPVPKPTNLRYGAGETWINFVWDEPSGYNNNEITFDGDTWETSNNYYFASGLAPGSDYTFKVKTVASDGRKSSAASIAAETECDVICYRRQSGEADAADDEQPPARQFGDGVHQVGVQVEPGRYAIGSPGDTSACEWQLYSSDGGGPSGGWVERMLITMGENDAAIYSSGCGTWYKQEE